MGIGKILRRQFLAGIIVILPIGVTIWVLVWIFTSINDILQPLLLSAPYWAAPWLGFVIVIVLVYLVGVMASNITTRRLVGYAESLLVRIPIVRPIYSSIKQIVDSFSAPGQDGFKQVVIAEFPMKGTRTIGFVTNELLDKDGGKLLCIFIPTAPNPTSGFLQIVREEDVIRVDMSVDDALKVVVSAGKVLPEEISKALSATS